MRKKELNIITLGERGQVTLPKAMRQRLGLGKNSKVAATMVGKTIVLHPIDDELERRGQVSTDCCPNGFFGHS